MNKTANYRQVRQRLQAAFTEERGERPPSDMVKMVTINAILKQELETFDWVGFYLTKTPNLLEVGPYQGSVGCLFIRFGQGVCGQAAAQGKPIIVPDVHTFPGHIACDAATRSEIVIPVFQGSRLLGVFDVDSHQPAAFDEIDRQFLEEILQRWFTRA